VRTHRHLVQFYETDLMGIVHHSNYLRFFEEARVAWAHEQGIIDYQKPESAAYFAVIETHVKHLRPARFGDHLTVQTQARLKGARIEFEYKCFNQADLLTEARTVHASLDQQLKLIRPPLTLKQKMENAPWIETWLSSL
jgi:acyl-CoA thioester hydrolase